MRSNENNQTTSCSFTAYGPTKMTYHLTQTDFHQICASVGRYAEGRLKGNVSRSFDFIRYKSVGLEVKESQVNEQT